MSIYHDARGRQVNVGGTVIQVPQSVPTTDAEIIHFEELIAHVEKAAAPSKAVVDTAKKLIDGFREDIQTSIRARLSAPRDEQQGDMFAAKTAEVVDVGHRIAPVEIAALPNGADEEGGAA